MWNLSRNTYTKKSLLKNTWNTYTKNVKPLKKHYTQKIEKTPTQKMWKLLRNTYTKNVKTLKKHLHKKNVKTLKKHLHTKNVKPLKKHLHKKCETS